MMSSRKRPRVTNDKLADLVWSHYQNYLDSLTEDGEGDIDEVQELLQLLQGKLPTNATQEKLGTSQQELLPLIASMAHYHLASHESDCSTILRHLQASLQCFPFNCATWFLGANYARLHSTGVSSATIAHWYLKAASYASDLRKQALILLEKDGDTVQEWVEVLVLNDMLGAEIVVGDDEEDTFVSSSAVEATSRFLAAMMLSTLGHHDDALSQLQHFGVTHRIHPNVWQNQGIANTNGDGPTFVTGGVLPESLYQQMCRVFGPDADYWRESDYERRGYYSYYFDIPKEPSNLVEHVTIRHLLPLAQPLTPQTILGCEWWVHTLPMQTNLGHNLHFDTDEALLAQQTVSHPVVSSVLYLTATSGAGATLVIDQTSDSTSLPNHCWSCIPQDNSFLMFDGRLLHGVLPCSKRQPKEKETCQDDACTVHWNLPSLEDTPHRLTFMVGFWTRRVATQERKLYGPCGPLPPLESTRWVQQMQDFDNKEDSRNEKFEITKVPKISPAWEQITKTTHIDNEEERLEIPRALDHGFFVKGAPECFRRSLFMKDHDEQDNEQ